MYLAAITSSPLLDAAFGLLALSPLAVMLALVVRHRRSRAKRLRASAFNHRTMAYHDAINSARGLYTRRGSATLDALAALALCLVLSAALVALIACADAADLAALVKP